VVKRVAATSGGNARTAIQPFSCVKAPAGNRRPSVSACPFVKMSRSWQSGRTRIGGLDKTQIPVLRSPPILSKVPSRAGNPAMSWGTGPVCLSLGGRPPASRGGPLSYRPHARPIASPVSLAGTIPTTRTSLRPHGLRGTFPGAPESSGRQDPVRGVRAASRARIHCKRPDSDGRSVTCWSACQPEPRARN